jgi:hypothetical protein
LFTRQGHKLPNYIFQEFKLLSGGTTEEHKKENLQQRNKLIQILNDAGWTYSSIGEASGISRERVRQILAMKTVKALARDVEIPVPPIKQERVPKVWPVPSTARLNRMLELQPKAQLVRSSSPNFRKEAEEYTALIYKVHKEEGVSLYRIASSLGLTPAAVYARLIRYGYKPVGKGKSGVYTAVLTSNRPLG